MKNLGIAALAVVGVLLSGASKGAEIPISPSAQEVAAKYLKAVMVADLPEGQKVMVANEWQRPPLLPVIQKHDTLYEGMFATDVAGVVGYKRLVQADVRSKANTTLNTRLLLIAYPLAATQEWKVFALTPGTDVDREIAAFERRLGDTTFTSLEVNYRQLGFWYMTAGRLREAERAYEKAVELNRSNTMLPQEQLEIARRIIGK